MFILGHSFESKWWWKDYFWTWLDKIQYSLALTRKTLPVKLSSAHSETHKSIRHDAAAQSHSKCKDHVLSHSASLHYWFSFHPVDRTKHRDLSERERKGRKKERARETEKYDAIMKTDVLCISATGNSMYSVGFMPVDLIHEPWLFTSAVKHKRPWQMCIMFWLKINWCMCSSHMVMQGSV